MESLEDQNLCIGCNDKRDCESWSNIKVTLDLVEAGDGAHGDNGNSLSEAPIHGYLNSNKTSMTSPGSDNMLNGEEVFKDPKTFDFLQQRGKKASSHDLRKISLYKKFDPLVSPQEASKGHEDIQEDVKFHERNENAACGLADNTNEPPAGTLHNPSRRLLFDSCGFEPSTSEKLKSPGTEVLESPVQKPCAEMSLRDQSLELPDSQYCPIGHSTLLPYSMAKKKLNETLNSFDAMISKYSRGCENKEKLREEVLLLREILMRQENIYRGDLNNLEEEIFDSNAENEALKKEIADKKGGQEYLRLALEEYEKTISSITSGMEKEKEHYISEIESLMQEIQQLKCHLDQQEKSFSDLYIKYGNSKSALKRQEEKEKMLREEIERYQAAIKKMERNCEILREHANEKLERANQELTSMKKNHQAEIAKLKAAIRRNEVKLYSLEATIAQKTRENKQLTLLCDELINQVDIDDHEEETLDGNNKEIPQQNKPPI